MSPPSNTAPDPSAIPSLHLGALGFDRGAHLLLDNGAPLPPSARLVVTGTDPTLRVHVGAWARTRGHRVELNRPDDALVVVRGTGNSLLGEGSFLNLLAFLERHAPDPVIAAIAHLYCRTRPATSRTGSRTSSSRCASTRHRRIRRRWSTYTESRHECLDAEVLVRRCRWRAVMAARRLSARRDVVEW